jgi:CRISPR-associated protein Cmr3
MVTALKEIAIAGPLPTGSAGLFLPAPKDIVVQEGDSARCYALRPLPDLGALCDMPPGVVPAMLPDTAKADFKPGVVPAFWSSARMAEWLTNPTGAGFAVPAVDGSQGFLATPQREERFHVSLDPATGAAAEGLLFKTVALALPEGIEMAARVRVAPGSPLAKYWTSLNASHSLGGERRMASFQASATGNWNCQPAVKDALKGAVRVRMILASPAIFRSGWRPGWLGENLVGSPPGSNVQLKLVSACVDRWKPISGWSLEKGSVGAKAIRRLARAGSVYFFEVLSGDASTLSGLWLESVCDCPQDRLDGFGLAVWGVWARH